MKRLQRRHVFSVLTAFSVSLAGWVIWVYWNSPYRVCRQIVAAIERKDIETLYHFVLDEEKQGLIVTKEVVQAVLNDFLYRHAPTVKAIKAPIERVGYGRITDEMYWFYVAWANGATGKPFPAPRDVVKVMTLKLELYKPPKRRWQFSFTIMARSYFLLNLPFKTPDGKPVPRRWYVRQAFSRWGIPAVFKRPQGVLMRGRFRFIWERWGKETL